jgi:putative FmdB family regulatory protein
MPIFEYICRECNHCFETIVQGSTVPACPVLKATALDKKFSVFGVERPVPGLRPEGELAEPAAIQEAQALAL